MKLKRSYRKSVKQFGCFPCLFSLPKLKAKYRKMTVTRRQKEAFDYLRDYPDRSTHVHPPAIPEALVQGKNIFVLKVKGDSMIDEEIRDGDLIIVEARSTAEDGETVVALVDREVALKKFYREDGGRVRLQPANEKLKPTVANGNQVEICGLVVAVIRKYQADLNRGDKK